jgi:hypothetical protein
LADASNAGKLSRLSNKISVGDGHILLPRLALLGALIDSRGTNLAAFQPAMEIPELGVQWVAGVDSQFPSPAASEIVNNNEHTPLVVTTQRSLSVIDKESGFDKH